MNKAENSDAIFTNTTSLRGGDVEEGSSGGHGNDMERNDLSIDASLANMTDGRNNNETVVDIDKWSDSMATVLEDVPEYMCRPGHPGRITRIPESLREVDVKAYEPYFLSIGPYHKGKPRLDSMEKKKQVVLKCFLEHKPDLSLKDYLIEIKSTEQAARSFYSDVEMDSEKFVQMLLLDTLFILPLFCGMPDTQERMSQTNIETGSRVESDDTNEMVNQMARGDIVSTQMMVMSGESNDGLRWFWTMFPHDLFLLENQLPFFVLEKIYKFAYGNPQTKLLDVMKEKVGLLLADYTKLDSEMVISPAEKVHHLLHLCHLFFRPKVQSEYMDCQLLESAQMFRLGSAVQLYEAGVNFEARFGLAQHSLLDITFSQSGKMVMLGLHVDDKINSMLRNLIALEQMTYPSLGLHISAYAVLLLHLVTTPDDVQLLRRKGIITHHLASDKEMMNIINRLSVGLAFDYVEDRYSLKPVFVELKKYSEHRVPRWRAWLKHRYFNNPWAAISLSAASLLLLMSAIQTYYAVYSYYYPYFDGHS